MSMEREVYDELSNMVGECIIDNKYYIESELGRGGFSIVFRGVEMPPTKRLVAIKVLPLKYIARKMGMEENAVIEAKNKVEEELEILGKLAGIEGVIRPYFHHFDESSSYYYIIMEYAGGGSLRKLLRSKAGEEKGLHVAEALTIMLTLMDILEEVHNRGVAHCDIKPENILFVSGKIKLIDFGIAKFFNRLEEISYSKQAEGYNTDIKFFSTFYSGFEQTTQRFTTAKNYVKLDIHALGVVFYEMLTGKLPYDTKESWKEYKPRDIGKCAPFEEPIALALKPPSERLESIAELRELIIEKGKEKGITPMDPSSVVPQDEEIDTNEIVKRSPCYSKPQAVPRTSKRSLVTINSIPPGAEVYIHGSPKKLKTRCTEAMDIGKEYRVRLEKAGYLPIEERIIPKKRKEELYFELEPAGVLFVDVRDEEGNAVDATIYLKEIGVEESSSWKDVGKSFENLHVPALQYRMRVRPDDPALLEKFAQLEEYSIDVGIAASAEMAMPTFVPVILRTKKADPLPVPDSIELRITVSEVANRNRIEIYHNFEKVGAGKLDYTVRAIRGDWIGIRGYRPLGERDWGSYFFWSKVIEGSESEVLIKMELVDRNDLSLGWKIEEKVGGQWREIGYRLSLGVDDHEFANIISKLEARGNGEDIKVFVADGCRYLQNIDEIEFVFPNIEVLELGKTRICDVRPIAALRSLRVLDLSNTEIRNVEPLASIRMLKVLYLNATPVARNKKQMRLLRQSLPGCEIIT